MTALTILGILVFIAFIGAKDSPPSEEELQKTVYKNSTQEVLVGRIIVMALVALFFLAIA